jgi:hypothetical protein
MREGLEYRSRSALVRYLEGISGKFRDGKAVMFGLRAGVVSYCSVSRTTHSVPSCNRDFRSEALGV